MENASKALLMAGGLLISIMVVTFMVVVLRKAGSMSAEYDVQMSENELASFNSQFELYAKEDNNFLDIITVSNMAYDVNQKNGYDAQNGVTVKVEIDKGNQKGTYKILIDSTLEKYYFFNVKNGGNTSVYMYDLVPEYTALKDQTTEYKYTFKCTGIDYNNITGKVKEISFQIVENK